MASFIYRKNPDGTYTGKGSMFGNAITVVAENFKALWSFFFGRK